MTTIEALRFKIDTLQLENQHLEVQNLKLAHEKPTTAVMVECELEKNRYKDECEILMVENGQLKALYEELLKKIEEESVSKLVEVLMSMLYQILPLQFLGDQLIC